MRDVMRESKHDLTYRIYTTTDNNNKSVDILNFEHATTLVRTDALTLNSSFLCLIKIHQNRNYSLKLIGMDMEKIETEFEFYNFTLDSLKKECKCFNTRAVYI